MKGVKEGATVLRLGPPAPPPHKHVSLRDSAVSDCRKLRACGTVPLKLLLFTASTARAGRFPID